MSTQQNKFLSLGVVEHKYVAPTADPAATTSDAELAHRRASSSASSSTSSISSTQLAKLPSGTRFLRLGVSANGEGDWFEVVEEEAVKSES